MEEETLEKALDLLASLISSCYSVRIFPLKWRLIRAKLEELSSNLHNASSCSTNSYLSSFCQSVFSTVNQIQLVEFQCSDESYNGGRLLLKSNLSQIISALDFHIEQLSEICFSSVDSPQFLAIVPAKPVIGTVDINYIKFYTNDIFSRLIIGSLDIKVRTLSTLGEFLGEDERYVHILMKEIDNGVGFLVSLLEKEDSRVKEEAVKVILVISQFEIYRGVLVKTGVIAPLVQLLEKGTKLPKEIAANILSKLTANSDNVWSFSAHGGVAAIINNFRNIDGNVGSDMICSCCVMLRNLMRIEEIKGFIIEEDAISVLIHLIKLKEVHEMRKIQLVELLSEMATNDDKVKTKMVNEGFIESLIQFLDPNSQISLKAREISLRAIQSFVQNIACNHLDLINSVILCLNHEETIIQELALQNLLNLSEISKENKISIGKLGSMKYLIILLQSKSFQAREMAASTIFNLVKLNPNRQIFMQDENNVKEVMRLLDPNERKSATTRFILSIIMVLSESKDGRRAIINSGYISHLEKLEELGVLDAKIIMKKLSSNIFQNIVSKIWSK